MTAFDMRAGACTSPYSARFQTAPAIGVFLMNLKLSPGTVFFSDAGRHNYIDGTLGDCATRAITALLANRITTADGKVTLAVSEPGVTPSPDYRRIQASIIDEKQRVFAEHADAWRALGFGEKWAATHVKPPGSVLLRVLRTYTNQNWCYYAVQKITGRRNQFRTIAKALSGFNLILISADHSVACREGIIIDTADTSRCLTERILIREAENHKIIGTLMGAI